MIEERLNVQVWNVSPICADQAIFVATQMKDRHAADEIRQWEVATDFAATRMLFYPLEKASFSDHVYKTRLANWLTPCSVIRLETS